MSDEPAVEVVGMHPAQLAAQLRMVGERRRGGQRQAGQSTRKGPENEAPVHPSYVGRGARTLDLPRSAAGRPAIDFRAPVRRLVLLTLALAVALPAGAQARDFPRNFLWGTAISAFQTEAGGRKANADRRSDWWVWSHDADNIAAGRVSGDRVERGPGHWSRYRSDALLARRRLAANAFRLSIEWSRVFPRSTAGARTPRQLDRLANRAAVRHYARELRALRASASSRC